MKTLMRLILIQIDDMGAGFGTSTNIIDGRN
jgi:hypothetical protein